MASERDFVAVINTLNAQWVTSARRLSPRVLTDLYERASGEAADLLRARSVIVYCWRVSAVCPAADA